MASRKKEKPVVMVGAVKHRSAAADITVQLNDLLKFRVDAISIQDKGDDRKLMSVCPTHHTDDEQAPAVKLEQQYICPDDDDHGPFAYDEVLRATDDKARTIVAAQTELAAVKEDAYTDEEKGTLMLMAHPFDEVAAATYPIGGTYVCRPVEKNGLFPILLERVGADGRIETSQGDIALQGQMIVRGSPKIVQLRTWNGNLVLQEMAKELKGDFGIYPEPIDERYVPLVDKLLLSMIEPFNPHQYRNLAKERLRAFTETRLAGEGDPIELPDVQPTKIQADAGDALLAALEASLEKVQT